MAGAALRSEGEGGSTSSGHLHAGRALLSNSCALILRGGHWVSCREVNVLSREGGEGHRSRTTGAMKGRAMWWGWRGEEGACAPWESGTPIPELRCEREEGWRGDYWEGALLPLHGPACPSVSCLQLCMSMAVLCRDLVKGQLSSCRFGLGPEHLNF